MDTLKPKSTESSGMSGSPAGVGHGPFHGHALMMLTCVPMLVLVGALLATGVIGASGLLFVVPCLVMMAAMMFLMAQSGPGSRNR